MTNKNLSEQIYEACGVDTNKYAYPDFENNNNNFVKLLNLYFSPRFKSILDYITSVYCCTCSTKDLLEQILDVLEYNPEADSIKCMKQAIRQADWEY